MTIRLRIALFLTLITAITVVVLGLFIDLLFRLHTEAEFNRQLRVRAEIAAQAFLGSDDMSSAIYQRIKERHFQTLPMERETMFSIAPDGSLKLINEGFHPSDAFVAEVRAERYAEGEDNVGNAQVGIIYDDEGTEYLVMVSAMDQYGHLMLRDLTELLIVGGTVAVLASFLLAFLLAHRVLQPLRLMVYDIRSMTAGDLGRRLKQKTGSEDETEVLKAEFNLMLDRLQTAFEMQDAFISNASHELRNPLTAIMGEAEVALARADRSTEDYIGSLSRILNEANRLEDISTALLRLAKACFDSRGFSSGSLRIDEMVWDVRRSMIAMNRNAQINIHMDHLPDDPDQLLVTGNEGLLAIALSNIIGNACKFSANAPVDVTLNDTVQQLVIIVKDRGIGISAIDLPHVFEPFFRSEGVRQIGGFGIGLPLSQRIVGMHGGQIKVESEVGSGTTVTIYFPKRTAASITV